MGDLYCGGVATPCLITVNAVDECSGEFLTDGPYGYAFDGVRAVEWEPVITEGTVAAFVDNCGRTVCENETPDDLLGYDLSFEKCALPSELVALLTGQPVITTRRPACAALRVSKASESCSRKERIIMQSKAPSPSAEKPLMATSWTHFPPRSRPSGKRT